MSAIALIAGAGALPAAVAAALPEAPLVCALDGIAPDGLAVDLVFRFERLVPFLRSLGDRGIETVVLAGAVHRPRLDPALFDRDTAALVPDLLAAMQGGDDGALRWVIGLIEEFGLAVAGITALAPDLIVTEGILGRRPPTAVETTDAARAAEVLAALDPVDVGQGCVVVQGLCLGVEVLFGTDAMLADVARHRATREPQGGGVFVKRAKAGQDLRADLPTVGVATVTAAQAAGLTGICLQAGRVVILDRAAVVAAVDAAGIALWAVP
ncbi:MAG: UDP-2,3-diacylglucosamine diphosphatase LpxI [Rhodobacter sp.]|nr:UDP-2,3-diacylglucosamine diphosphatase LpxI [Paracoccaceae bacterium]MCC0077151.1 UDP-2,3-diacylglucosamine diphosphatase LpxI [Rhodobacter sp.]